MRANNVSKNEEDALLTAYLYYTHLKIQISSNVLLSQFMRNSKAVGVLWGIFTVCYTVLIIVVFLQVSLSPYQYMLDSRNSRICMSSFSN